MSKCTNMKYMNKVELKKYLFWGILRNIIVGPSFEAVFVNISKILKSQNCEYIAIIWILIVEIWIRSWTFFASKVQSRRKIVGELWSFEGFWVNQERGSKTLLLTTAWIGKRQNFETKTKRNMQTIWLVLHVFDSCFCEAF